MKQQLRKCLIDYEPNEIFYFHKWVDEGRKKLHPENPNGDLIYAETFALCENIKTGQVNKADVDSIKFINESESKVIPELSDEEIKEWIDSTPYYGHCTTEYKEGLDDGIKWYREQLKQRQ